MECPFTFNHTYVRDMPNWNNTERILLLFNNWGLFALNSFGLNGITIESIQLYLCQTNFALVYFNGNQITPQPLRLHIERKTEQHKNNVHRIMMIYFCSFTVTIRDEFSDAHIFPNESCTIRVNLSSPFHLRTMRIVLTHFHTNQSLWHFLPFLYF